jgi:hypothetical protein
MSWWRSLDALERWSESHPTHLAIFGAAMRYLSTLGPAARLAALYHEVSVLPVDGQLFEYVDCRPGTGPERGHLNREQRSCTGAGICATVRALLSKSNRSRRVQPPARRRRRALRRLPARPALGRRDARRRGRRVRLAVLARRAHGRDGGVRARRGGGVAEPRAQAAWVAGTALVLPYYGAEAFALHALAGTPDVAALAAVSGWAPPR